jgi:hypothetical protein
MNLQNYLFIGYNDIDDDIADLFFNLPEDTLTIDGLPASEVGFNRTLEVLKKLVEQEHTEFFEGEYDKKIIVDIFNQKGKLSKEELRDLYPIENFDRVYDFLIRNEWVDCFVQDEWVKFLTDEAELKAFY